MLDIPEATPCPQVSLEALAALSLRGGKGEGQMEEKSKGGEMEMPYGSLARELVYRYLQALTSNLNSILSPELLCVLSGLSFPVSGIGNS